MNGDAWARSAGEGKGADFFFTAQLQPITAPSAAPAVPGPAHALAPTPLDLGTAHRYLTTGRAIGTASPEGRPQGIISDSRGPLSASAAAGANGSGGNNTSASRLPLNPHEEAPCCETPAPVFADIAAPPTGSPSWEGSSVCGSANPNSPASAASGPSLDRCGDAPTATLSAAATPKVSYPGVRAVSTHASASPTLRDNWFGMDYGICLQRQLLSPASHLSLVNLTRHIPRLPQL